VEESAKSLATYRLALSAFSPQYEQCPNLCYPPDVLISIFL
jgi:hypothetical protein